LQQRRGGVRALRVRHARELVFARRGEAVGKLRVPFFQGVDAEAFRRVKCGRLRAVFLMANSTSVGSSDKEINELAVNPCGEPSVPRHVMTATAPGQLAKKF